MTEGFEKGRRESVLEALTLGACFVIGLGIAAYEGAKALLKTEINAYREERSYGGKR